jgi:putative endonuclease
MSNKARTVLYVGVTNNLERRIFEHKNHSLKGFTDRYNCEDLIYYEETKKIDEAIQREKQIKGWGRVKKDQLIDTTNPHKRDLSTSSR